MVQQEDIILVNIYASNIGAPNYTNNILQDFLKKEINRSTVIVEDFNIHCQQWTYLPDKKKINKDIVALNDTIGQMDFINIYRTFHSKEAENTFFLKAHRTFSKIDHIER